MTTKLEEALEMFLEGDEFASAIISSTKAGFAGSGYSVALLPDGTHHVLWNNQIGNLYETPGVILGIPKLSDEDYQDLCEMAGELADDDQLAKELLGFVDFMIESAHELRRDLTDRLAMREA